jgi:hypothetical protein
MGARWRGEGSKPLTDGEADGTSRKATKGAAESSEKRGEPVVVNG